MSPRRTKRIMMISTHGYVSAEPEFGMPDTGGQVVYVLELSKCLARMGYKVDIYTRRFNSLPQIERVDDRVRVVRIPCGGNEFIPKETLCDQIPEWVENAAEFIKKKKLSYDFINSHYWDAGLAGQAMANRLEIPHFHTPHSIGAWKRDNMDGNADELEATYNFKHRIREERVIYHECDFVVATTPVQRDLLNNGEYDVSTDKIHTIPPGYDDRRFFPVSNATKMALKEEFHMEGPTVLALGRMAKNKGYDLLIKAMPAVLSRVPEARLKLAVGANESSPSESKQIDHLKQIAEELGVFDRIDFSGYITDEELADHYRAADVFALCSRYEPFGMTAVEAMACGTPTVITTEGGLWEQVTWGLEALYENPFQPDAYGHAIATILQRPEVARQLSRHGSHKARARFTWTGIAQQLLRLLEADPVRNTKLEQPVDEDVDEDDEIESALGQTDETDERLERSSV